LIKVSKDLVCILVSNKNLTKVLPSSGLGPGPGEVGQRGQKSSTYDVTHKKTAIPSQKIFSLQTWRLTKSFEGLNSFLVQLLMKKFLCKNLRKLLDF